MLTKAQLEMRKTGLGGSDIAAALGLSPWKTQLQLWADKCGDPEPLEESKYMEWGNRLESSIYAKFEDNNKHLRVSHAGGTLRHEEHKFLLATPDGFIVDDTEAGILEVKTSSHQVWDEVPAHYLLQVQHYMYVTGRAFAYFAVLFRGSDYREYGPYRINRDDYENAILPELQKFWDCVASKNPVFKPTSLADLSLIVDIDDEEPMLVDDNLRLVVEDYQDAMQKVKKLTALAKEYKMVIATGMGSHNKLVDVSGRAIALQLDYPETRIVDSKRIKAEAPDVFGQYSKVKKGYRTVRIY